MEIDFCDGEPSVTREDVVSTNHTRIPLLLGFIGLIIFLCGFISGYFLTPLIDSRTFNFTVAPAPLVIESNTAVSDLFLINYGGEPAITVNGSNVTLSHSTVISNTGEKSLPSGSSLIETARGYVPVMQRPPWYQALLFGTMPENVLTDVMGSSDDIGTVLKGATIDLKDGALLIGSKRFILIDSHITGGEVQSYYPIIVKDSMLINTKVILTEAVLPDDWDSDSFDGLPKLKGCILENMTIRNAAVSGGKEVTQ